MRLNQLICRMLRRAQIITATCGVLLGFSVGAAAMGTVAADDASEDLVQYFGPRPLPDLSMITREALEQSTQASELVDANKSDFCGSYVNGSSEVIVMVATDRGYGLATRAFDNNPAVSIRWGDRSLAEVNDFGLLIFRSLPSISDEIWMWAIDPTTCVLQLGILQPFDDVQTSLIAKFATTNELPIAIYIDETAARPEKSNRLEDGSPFSGGFRYVAANGTTSGATQGTSCSGGFGYEIGSTDYILTAGHCFEKGTSFDQMWNTFAGPCCTKKTHIGHRSNTTWNDGDGTVRAGGDDAHHGDLALVNVSIAGKQAGHSIWWPDNNSKIPVTARVPPTVSQQICINAWVSGSDCGLGVVYTNENYVYNDGDVLINGDVGFSTSTADCSQPGDSGGSVIIDHSGAETQATAVGIVSGRETSDACLQFFTGAEEAIQAWGGHLNVQ